MAEWESATGEREGEVEREGRTRERGEAVLMRLHVLGRHWSSLVGKRSRRAKWDCSDSWNKTRVRRTGKATSGVHKLSTWRNSGRMP